MIGSEQLRQTKQKDSKNKWAATTVIHTCPCHPVSQMRWYTLDYEHDYVLFSLHISLSITLVQTGLQLISSQYFVIELYKLFMYFVANPNLAFLFLRLICVLHLVWNPLRSCWYILFSSSNLWHICASILQVVSWLRIFFGPLLLWSLMIYHNVYDCKPHQCTLELTAY